MTDEEPLGWLFLRSEVVPDRWRDRAQPALLVPLLRGETENLLSEGQVEPEILLRDEPLARLAARGRTAAAIARELGLSRRTVERRLAALRLRLGVDSTAELALVLSQRGF